jgi:hypothetical protein
LNELLGNRLLAPTPAAVVVAKNISALLIATMGSDQPGKLVEKSGELLVNNLEWLAAVAVCPERLDVCRLISLREAKNELVAVKHIRHLANYLGVVLE